MGTTLNKSQVPHDINLTRESIRQPGHTLDACKGKQRAGRLGADSKGVSHPLEDGESSDFV